jgi:rfaE bifunctional protein nucleotidyltransferase chain/domain
VSHRSASAAKIVALEEVPARLEALRRAGKRVALANGVFDLIHVGHVRYLEGARALADLLVVAVNSDRSTRAYKGDGRPVVPEHERAELVAALGCTDWVVVFDEADVRRVISIVRPDVHVKGTDYTPDTIPERDAVLAYGRPEGPQHHRAQAAPRAVGYDSLRKGRMTMALSAELKEILVCPKCKGDLLFLEDRQEIHCRACRLAYPIREDIPVMLPEEARPLGTEDSANG